MSYKPTKANIEYYTQRRHEIIGETKGWISIWVLFIFCVGALVYRYPIFSSVDHWFVAGYGLANVLRLMHKYQKIAYDELYAVNLINETKDGVALQRSVPWWAIPVVLLCTLAIGVYYGG